jgi:hypothetical protein
MVRARLAILGAGPIGLEAALEGAARGFDVRVFEARVVGAALCDWGHVRMFSPWAMNVSARGRERLGRAGWEAPPDGALPSGRALVDRYLQPIAALPELQGRIETGWRVEAIGREGLLKEDRVGSDERLRFPLRILLRDERGRERFERADLIADCTGVWGTPRGFGDGGLPVAGEREVADRIARRLEDVRGARRDRYADRTTLVVGSGYSAATVAIDLAALAREAPGTRVVWALRGEGDPFAIDPADPLPERARIGRAANALAGGESPAVRAIRGARIERMAARGEGVDVDVRVGPSVERIVVDRVVACAGFGPDETIYRELQVHQCYASLGPMKLAAALSAQGGGDCLAQRAFGPESLRGPEPGFVVLGAKSYGRSPSFLLRVGHEQVRDAFVLFEAWRGMVSAS